MLEFRTTREVAELFGVQEWEVESVLRRRDVERPPIVGGVRLWTEDRVAKVRDALVRRGRLPETEQTARS